MNGYHLVIFYTDPHEVQFLLAISSVEEVPSARAVPFEAPDNAMAIITARGIINMDPDIVHFAMLRTGSDPQATDAKEIVAWLNLEQTVGARFIATNGEPNQLEEAEEGCYFFRR